MRDKYGQRFDEYIKNWEQVRAIINHNKTYTKEDLSYAMQFSWFTDYSLVSNESVFRYKLPHMLRNMWHGGYQALLNFITDITDLEKKIAKEDGINDLELKHICYLKNIANYVLKTRFPEMDIKTRKKGV